MADLKDFGQGFGREGAAAGGFTISTSSEMTEVSGSVMLWLTIRLSVGTKKVTKSQTFWSVSVTPLEKQGHCQSREGFEMVDVGHSKKQSDFCSVTPNFAWSLHL